MESREEAVAETAPVVVNGPATRARRASRSPPQSETGLGSNDSINDRLREAHDLSSVRLRSSTFQHSQQLNSSREARPPPEMEKQDDDEKLPPKTHNTRLRNGIHKVKRKVSIEGRIMVACRDRGVLAVSYWCHVW